MLAMPQGTAQGPVFKESVWTQDVAAIERDTQQERPGPGAVGTLGREAQGEEALAKDASQGR